MYSSVVSEHSVYTQNDSLLFKVSEKTAFAGNINTERTYNGFEIWVILSDSTFTVEGVLCPVYEGDVFIFPDEAPRTVSYVSNDYDFISIQINSFAFSGIMPKDSLFGKNFFSADSDDFHNIISADTDAAQKTSIVAQNLVSVFENQNEHTVSEAFLLIMEILGILSNSPEYKRTASKAKKDVFANRKRAMSVNSVIDYINIHFAEDITLKNISDYTGISPNYLSNIFKQHTGKKLWDYIGEKRINAAKALLLENPDDSVISIALKCGYNNCPNFNRAFKKYAGMTPNEYKKAFLR